MTALLRRGPETADTLALAQNEADQAKRTKQDNQ
jgi:hypothetical protein